jgi:hypothetical protein
MVPLPYRRKLVRCRWIYRTESTTNGHIRRYKSRLIAKGFQQVDGIDYDDIFVPIANMYSIHLEISIVTIKG